MPLKEQNSPRSQWISNVSLLKNQLKDGELIESSKNQNESKATKLTWNELEAQLGKRMREKARAAPSASARTTTTSTTTTDRSKLLPINTTTPLKSVGGTNGSAINPLSPTSSTLNLIPHPRSPTRSTSMNAPLPPGIPFSPSKRPALNIPVSPRSQDVLKQVHSGTAQLQGGSTHRSPNTTGTTATTSRTKPATTKHSNFVDTKMASRNQNSPTDADGLYNTTVKHESNTVEPSSLRKKSKQQPPQETTVLTSIEESIHESHHNGETPVEPQPTHITTDDIHKVKASMNRETLNSIKPYGGAESVVSVQQQKTPAASQTRSNQNKNKVPRPETTTSKTKGSMSWLRRALKPNGSKPTKRSINMSNMTAVSILTTDSVNTKSSSKNGGYSTSSKSNGKSIKTIEKYFHPTTPLQLGLWLSEVHKAIRLAKEGSNQQVQQRNTPIDHNSTSTPMLMVDALPSSSQQRNVDREDLQQQQQQQLRGDGTVNTLGGEGEDVYYHKNRDIGVYVDYSTFDDGDSVSSIELLFKWLTCRDLNDAATMDNGSIGRHYRGDGTVMTPPGTVIATESNVSDDLSIDLDARPTRRTFFSR